MARSKLSSASGMRRNSLSAVPRAYQTSALGCSARALSEALSAAGEEFGEERIREAIAAPGSDSTDARLQALLASVKHFTHGAVQNDDVTAMIVKYLATER